MTENSPVLESVGVRATDRDIGQNGNISYEITSGNTNDTFVIGKLTHCTLKSIHFLSFNYEYFKSADIYGGAIHRNPLNQINREFQARYDIEIVARDGGISERNDTTLVIIDILVRHKPFCCK